MMALFLREVPLTRPAQQVEIPSMRFFATKLHGIHYPHISQY